MPDAEGRRASGPVQAQAEAPARSRAIPGLVAFVTALYAALYLVWEQSHWGSAALRDLIGNVAFMPLNLGVRCCSPWPRGSRSWIRGCAGRSA